MIRLSDWPSFIRKPIYITNHKAPSYHEYVTIMVNSALCYSPTFFIILVLALLGVLLMFVSVNFEGLVGDYLSHGTRGKEVLCLTCTFTLQYLTTMNSF